MNTDSLQIFCGREPFFRDVKFWIKHRFDNQVSYAAPLTLTRITPENEGREMPPVFTLRDEGCQHLMDELWRVGFRPSEGSGSAGSLAATERHLADMRHLLFKTKPQ